MGQILVHIDGRHVPTRDMAYGGVYQDKALTFALRRTLDAARSNVPIAPAIAHQPAHRRDKMGIQRGVPRISPRTRGSKI